MIDSINSWFSFLFLFTCSIPLRTDHRPWSFDRIPIAVTNRSTSDLEADGKPLQTRGPARPWPHFLPIRTIPHNGAIWWEGSNENCTPLLERWIQSIQLFTICLIIIITTLEYFFWNSFTFGFLFSSHIVIQFTKKKVPLTKSPNYRRSIEEDETWSCMLYGSNPAMFLRQSARWSVSQSLLGITYSISPSPPSPQIYIHPLQGLNPSFDAQIPSIVVKASVGQQYPLPLC